MTCTQTGQTDARTPEQATILTRRSRIGFGWSNRPVQDGETLRIASVTKPTEFGSPRTILEKAGEIGQLNSGNCWRRCYFVRDYAGNWRRVVSCLGESIHFDLLMLAWKEVDEIDVEFV